MAQISEELFFSIFRKSYKNIPNPRFTGKRDLEILVALASAFKPKRIVEFGVQDGWTASTLLHSIESIVSYIGIDIPYGEKTILPEQRGEVPQNPASKICDSRFKLILQDSKTLTFEDLDEADFVFIDGDHSKLGVESDTKLAYRLIKNKGIIVWHDYKDQKGFGVKDLIDYLNKYNGNYITNIVGSLVCFEIII